MRLRTLALWTTFLASCGGGSADPVGSDVDGRYVSDLKTSWSHGTATGSGPVPLTHAPMDPVNVAQLVPYGFMVGGHVTPIDHQYFAPLDPNLGLTAYEVKSAATGHIVQISHRSNSNPSPHNEYRIIIEHSGTFWTYYDLVTQLDPAIGSAPSGGQTVNVRVPVQGGQIIGKIGVITLDFGVVNTDITLPGFIVPQHYDREPWKIHTVDPFDYFVEPVRTQLLALDPRTVSPRCGKIDYDIDGTLVGNWFRLGTNGYEGIGDPYWRGHVAFAYHHIDTAAYWFSFGDWQGTEQQLFLKNNAGPDPATVTEATGPVEYELVQAMVSSSSSNIVGNLGSMVLGVALVQVLPHRQIRLELFPGMNASQVSGFTAAAKIYER